MFIVAENTGSVNIKHYKHQHIILLQRVRIEAIQINIWHPDVQWQNDMKNFIIKSNAKTIAQ